VSRARTAHLSDSRKFVIGVAAFLLILLSATLSAHSQTVAVQPSSAALETNATARELSEATDLAPTRPILRLTLPPYAYDVHAVEIAVVRRGFEIAGYELALVTLPNERVLRSSAAGKFDGVLLRESTITDTYNTLIMLSPALRMNPIWVWVNPQSDCPNNLSELAQLKPVNILGVPYFDQLIELSKIGHVQTHSPAAALKVIKSGRADYITGTIANMKHFRLTPNMKLKRCFEQPLFSVNSHPFVHLKHADKVDALEAGIRQALAENSQQPLIPTTSNHQP
jgi:hypothetical protein